MKGKKLILFTLLIFLTIQEFSAAARKKIQTEDELSLFQIDQLIRSTEYDEALRQLKVYIENNPLKFDLAQQRIKKIMNARKSYSELAEKLIELITNDPGNNKEIYEITSRLEQFEKYPSDENLKFIADLKKSAEFNYFRSLFLELQESSAALVAQKKYVEAAGKAKEGFWLYRDNFYEEWAEHPEITQKVDEQLERVEKVYSAYIDNNYQKKLNESLNLFIKAMDNDNYVEAEERYSQCVNNYSQIAQSIKVFVDVSQELNEVFEETKILNPDLSDASFLPFVTRFINGAPGVENSGIRGALEGQWDHLIVSMDSAVLKNIDRHYNQYSDSFGNSVFSNSDVILNQNNQKEIQNIANAADISGKIVDLDNQVHSESIVKNSHTEDIYINQLSLKMNDLIRTGVQLKRDELFNDPENIMKEIAGISGITGNKSQYDLAEYGWYKDYTSAELTKWDEFGVKYKNFVDELFDVSLKLSLIGWSELETYYAEKNDDYIRKSDEKLLLVEKMEGGFDEVLESQIHKDFLKSPEQAFDYVQANQNEKTGDITYFYPDICYIAADNLYKQINDSISAINQMEKSLLANYNSYEDFKSREDIGEVISRTVDGFKNTIEAMKKYADVLSALKERNQTRMVNSQLARNEADFRYSEAQQALKKDQFDIARRKLQESLSKYDEALSLQNDYDFRLECDEKLMVLGNQITKAENEIVVKEVRVLKNQAKDAYFNGRFEDAEKLLSQAKNRWAVTNVEEDEEINNLMNYVNNAISMQTGREILPSAPLYPEMSQLLNIAYQYFDEGSKKINSGKRTEGEADLDLALENLQKLQFVYPINQEASILTLKINRLKDPKKFAEEFDQKIQTARVMCRNKETQQTGYANLKDYQALDPKYKGLSDLIYQVEIEIGIRQKKVENNDIQKAKNLVKDGQNLFNKAGNDVAKLRNALDKVNQAIKLNPDNVEAQNLKDRITTKIGGNTITVLSTEDESLYQIAVKKLQNNDIIGANVIANQLLSKPQNGSIKKVKELKNKIDARL